MSGSDGGVGLALTMSNLASWRTGDDLQLVSWNAGIGYFSTFQEVGEFAQNGPADADVQLTNAQLDFGDRDFSLVEAGDI